MSKFKNFTHWVESLTLRRRSDEPLVESYEPYDAIKNSTSNLKIRPRLPLPESCLSNIDAAFYFYDRKRDDRTVGAQSGDKVFLLSHGIVWAYVSCLIIILAISILINGFIFSSQKLKAVALTE